MRYPLLVLFILIAGFSTHTLSGQEIAFHQLTTSNTNCLLKDRDGFVWIGTQDGLLRYDANEFRVFRHQSEDSTSLPNNFVWCLMQDPKEHIWVGTYGGGLAMWDKYNETFTTYPVDLSSSPGAGSNSVRSLHLLNDSLLLVGTEQGCRVFHLAERRFVIDQQFLEDRTIYAMYCGPGEDEALVGTDQGLYIISLWHQTSARQLQLPYDASQEVRQIMMHDSRMYIAGGRGLFVTEDLILFADHLKDHRQPSVGVYQFFVDDASDMWLATDRGLGHYESRKGYQWYSADRDHPFGLRSGTIQCIAQADAGILFAGTRQGVHQFSTVALSLRRFDASVQTDGCSHLGLDMLEDHTGNMWVTTEKGLLKITIGQSQSDWVVTCYPAAKTPGMPNGRINNISQDSNLDFWIVGDENAFARMQENNGAIQLQHYPTTRSWLGDVGITQVFQDSHGDLWIATDGKGLLRFLPAADGVRIYDLGHGLTDLSITQVYEDRRRQMWVATAQGGFCYYMRSAECFTCEVSDKGDPENLLSNTVYSIYEDRKGRFWICTPDGVNIRQRNADAFRSLTSVDGLPTDTVFSVLEDISGHIWLNTLEGVVMLRERGNAWAVENFNTDLGLPGPQSRQRPFVLHSSGLMFFGGEEGIVVWNPEYYHAQFTDPGVVLTDLQLYGESVAVTAYGGEGTFTLDSNINDVKQIVLEYNQNSLGFKFSALQFGIAGSPVYAYRMVGVDEDWIRTNDRRFARYPNLPPGRYTFMVGIGAHETVENIRALEIRIRPPWWRSWWMYLMYGGFAFLGFYVLLWTHAERTRAVEQARIAERDRMRERLARDFHDEAGNQITVMSLLTERARQEARGMPEVTDLLDAIQDKIQQFRSGMRDFIWIVDPRSDTLFEVIKRFGDFAEEVCEQAGVDLVLIGKSEALNKIVMSGHERRHFLLIFKEALHNSLKHAAASCITFSIHEEPQWAFVLADDGRGFDDACHGDGHGLHNMRKRAELIDAGLVVESAPGTGTRVVLQWSTGAQKESIDIQETPAVV